MSATAELVSALVELESVNPGLDARGAGEGAIADYVAGWLRAEGVEVEIDEPRPGRRSVIGRIRGTGSGPTLLLNGHLDTVSLGGEWAGTRARVEGDRLFGRGAYDMKGGVAAILLAARELRGVRLAGDVVIAAVADEEDRSLGTISLLERVDIVADAAIVTEPTALDLAIAHKGFAWFTVEAAGRAAHGSRPQDGRDAILALAPVLTRLAALAQRLAEGDAHTLLGCGSVHASTIAGGAEVSSYPASCTLTLERRTVPGEDAELLAAELDALVADAPEASWRLELEREPFEVAADAPLVASLRRLAAEASGREPQLIGYDPWTDAALLAAAGVPTVVFGPGGDGAHAAREWVSLPDVERCAHALAQVATDVCGVG